MAKGWTQARLAEELNKSQPTVFRWEKEDSATLPSREDALRLCRVLGISRDWLEKGTGRARDGFAEDEQPIRMGMGLGFPPGMTAEPPRDTGLKEAPIYGAAEGGEGQIILFRDRDPIDYDVPPRSLRHMNDAFGVLVVGESMSPRFEPRDVVWIDPHRPVRPGDDVLFLRSTDGLTEEIAVLKRLVRIAEHDFHVRQFNPDREFPLPKDEFRPFYVAGRV